MTDQHQKALLDIVRYQLFGGEKPSVRDDDIPAILSEAQAQTVFTTVFPFLKNDLKRISPESLAAKQEIFFANVMTNTANFMEHGELHRLMTENRIPYCTLKGIASAYYYPEASLRDMGDVDFLVNDRDFAAAKQAVLGAGFVVDHGDDADGIHVAFSRPPMSIWEQHRSVNGIPGGVAGEKIRAELTHIIETAELIELDGAVCFIPDAFHHGLIMLLHIISHMTSEGIGLRHLCDWAVFVNRLDSDAFRTLFEVKLKSFGMWRFAQIMTLVSERYLGVSQKEWAQNEEIDGTLLEELMTDILNGGNFGKKDLNRYREIKYISNRGEGTVDRKNVISQAFATLNQKTCKDFALIDRHRALLPAGWIAEGGKYVGLLFKGQRKSQKTAAMLREAAKRKDIYSQMALFAAPDSEER